MKNKEKKIRENQAHEELQSYLKVASCSPVAKIRMRHRGLGCYELEIAVYIRKSKLVFRK